MDNHSAYLYTLALQEVARIPIRELKILMAMAAMNTLKTSIGVEVMMIMTLNQTQCAVRVEVEQQVTNGGY